MSPSEWVALISILAGLASLVYQTYAKRQDDKRAAQLDRLNRQLSQLYGPLYALYEEGERNWLLFVARFSHDERPLAERTFLPSSDHRFPPPAPEGILEYRRRMERLFMPTNVEMEKALVEHADLVVGTRMPDEFSDFLAHVAAAKLLMHRWKTDPALSPDLWQQHHIEYPHPQTLKHRIRASFEELKETQQELLSGSRRSINEKELESRINDRMAKLADQWKLAGPSYSDRFREASAQPT